MRIAATMASDGQLMTSWGARSHFNIQEFLCKCGVCVYNRVDQNLVDHLETIRLQLAKPITVVSGIRCPKHNEKAGGAEHSQHLPDASGISGAADLYASGISSAKLFMLAMMNQVPGRGIGATKVHIDSRENPASWMYGDHKGKKPEEWVTSLIEDAFKE